MRRTAIAGGLAGVILLAGLILLRGPNRTSAADPKPEPAEKPGTVKTSGSATVRVKPDAARVFFGIQTQAAAIAEARADNNSRVRKVMTALAALKIPDLKSKTSDMQVSILYGKSDGHVLPPVTGYRITTTFTVLVQDDDPVKLGGLAARVLDAALENGANSIEQITFLRREGLNEARRKALKAAVEDALANARALAAGAKQGPVKVVTIAGEPQYRPWGYGGRNALMQTANVLMPQGGNTDASLVVGDLEVTCTVQVTCHY